MNGRTEHKILIEGKTVKKIKFSGHDLIGYYNYMSAKYEHKTKEVYVGYVIRFLDVINKEGSQITTSDINNYLTSLTYKTDNKGEIGETSGTYRATIHSALKTYFDYLESVKEIQVNPMTYVPRPSRKKDNLIERVYLKPFELQYMVDEVKTTRMKDWQKNRDLLILMTFLYTGIRCTALTEINMEDVNIKDKTLTIIDKRNKKRVFEIDDQMIELYKKVCHYNIEKKWKTDALFVSTHGLRISASSVSKMIEKYTRNMNKHITPHKLRRSYGTNMYQETGDIYAVKAALGHEDIKTTQIYVNIDNTEAAAKGMMAMKKHVQF